MKQIKSFFAFLAVTVAIVGIGAAVSAFTSPSHKVANPEQKVFTIVYFEYNGSAGQDEPEAYTQVESESDISTTGTTNFGGVSFNTADFALANGLPPAAMLQNTVASYTPPTSPTEHTKQFTYLSKTVTAINK